MYIGIHNVKKRDVHPMSRMMTINYVCRKSIVGFINLADRPNVQLIVEFIVTVMRMILSKLRYVC